MMQVRWCLTSEVAEGRRPFFDGKPRSGLARQSTDLLVVFTSNFWRLLSTTQQLPKHQKNPILLEDIHHVENYRRWRQDKCPGYVISLSFNPIAARAIPHGGVRAKEACWTA